MADTPDNFAPGWPGIEPRWTSSAKSGVGTALNRGSRIWFTLSHGILDEVYSPRVDQACLRDMGLVITGTNGFFSEEKRNTTNQIEMLGPGVPAYRLTNTCTEGRYRITKTIICDPDRPAVMQHIKFEALAGQPDDYRLYVIAAPHLYNQGMGNTAWLGDYKGIEMLFASREKRAMAVGCSAPWVGRSVGFVGYSDGWQDLTQNGRLTRFYTRAENGNVALTGELPMFAAANGGVVLALAIGDSAEEAGQRARASLFRGFDDAAAAYSKEWADWQREFPFPSGQAFDDLAHTSTAVLRTHEDKSFPGGIIASLSIPWGTIKGDNDLGGYHLVWPRDVVETAGGLLAAGARHSALRVFEYLNSTQEADGHWPQNQWLDGSAYWRGIQMDETSFPILLLDLLRRDGILDDESARRYHEMGRAAAGYLVKYGPVTDQDRWEEDPGYSPFTLAAEIAALLVAAEFAELVGHPERAQYLRETADIWNQSIERWTYVTGTPLAQKYGVEGYYVRIGEPDDPEAASPMQGYVPIKNRPPGDSTKLASEIVSPDFLALVRFGLRDPHDPRILNTLKVVDGLLKVDLPQGPGWRRYNGDGYGEHEDGSPFDGTGIGRVWPLLTGERAHYEIAAGNFEAAMALRQNFAASGNRSGLLPEQVWDAADIPERELYFGQASGSARPLAWAHAEYLKLCRSLQDRRVFDQPSQTTKRYLIDHTTTDLQTWRFNNKCRVLERGKRLRIELLAPAMIHWSSNNWQSATDTTTRNSGFGIYYADLPTKNLPQGAVLTFTFFWTDAGHWEGADFYAVVQ